MSVNVAAEKKVNFELVYQEVLQRRLGYYEHVINIDPGQVVPDLQVEVHINESRNIRDLFVPAIRKRNEHLLLNGKNFIKVQVKSSISISKQIAWKVFFRKHVTFKVKKNFVSVLSKCFTKLFFR